MRLLTAAMRAVTAITRDTYDWMIDRCDVVARDCDTERSTRRDARAARALGSSSARQPYPNE